MSSIMIVSSNSQSSEITNKYLFQAGYTVLTADNGANAIAKAKLFMPDLILLETSLMDMSGYDVCKKLKRSPETKSILIVILSDLDSREQASKALIAEADDFLLKSFDEPMFLSKIRAIFRVKNLGDELKEQYASLKKNEKRTRYEMKMATQVQRSLIQEFDTTINDTYFFSKYLPAMDIGGDFYDVIKLDDRYISVIMGDVSGHGIPAALLTSMLSVMIKTSVAYDPHPGHMLEKVNTDFCNVFSKGITDIYACMFCILIDTKDHILTYANAGHPLPYYIDLQNDTSVELTASGMPIGLMEDTKYESASIKYNSNDVLFLQTDGLQDVFYKDSPDLYSRKLREILVDSSTMPVNELIDIVLDVFYKLDPLERKKHEIDDVSIIFCKL